MYVIGNGGSLANASHIVSDLLAKGIKAYSPDIAFTSAVANDHGYAFTFSRWIDIVGEEGDVLIAMSGSGKSPNILNAIEVATVRGMSIIKLFGNEVGLGMQEAEERQLAIGHELWRSL